MPWPYKSEKPKRIYIKNHRYIAVKKLVERPDPYQLTTRQSYTPSTLKRVAHRKVTIKLDCPVTHEIHLAKNTVVDSLEAINEPNIPVALMFHLRGNTNNIINRRVGITVYIYEESAYYILRWDDVLYNPMKEKTYTGHAQTKRKLERCQYPTERFTRNEKKSYIHHLQKATPEEYIIIIEAFKQHSTNVLNNTEETT